MKRGFTSGKIGGKPAEVFFCVTYKIQALMRTYLSSIRPIGIVLVLLLMLFSACGNVHEVHEVQVSDKYVTPTTKVVNMRRGPGTKYGIVTKVKSGEVLKVMDDSDSLWTKVTTAKGREGYVSSKYLAITDAAPETETVISSSDEASSIQATEQPKITYRNEDGMTSTFASYALFMLANPLRAYIVLAVLFIIEFALYYWLRRKYNYIDDCDSESSVTVGYIFVALSAVLTVLQMKGIFEIRKTPSSDDMMFVLMLLSTGLLMAMLPWRIKISGLDDITDRYKGDRVKWGGRIGFITWAVLLWPLCNFYLDIPDYINVDYSDETMGGMIWTMLKFWFFTGAFCWIVWPYFIVKYCLRSMGSNMLWILNWVIAYGIGKYGYYMCDTSFSGLIYIVSLWGLFMIVCCNIGLMFGTINERRCGNCHMFEGNYMGKTDLGHSYSTVTRWESDNDDFARANKSRDYAAVSDTKVKIRSTYRTNRWKTHHSCPYCDEKWDINHKEKYAVNHETLGHKWTEHWLE